MNVSERFFRRYVFSAIGIVVFFLVVNILLVGSYLAVAYLENVADSNFPIENLSNHIVLEDGQFVGDGQVTEMLNKANAWAMILDGDGMVVWEEKLPEELPRHYSSMDVAMFSRWYLNDYPVNIWNRQDSLLVVGFPQEDIVNYYISIKTQYVGPIAFGLLAAISINFF
ncbi:MULTISPECIES: hypothetical protein [Eisenbergiella]|uniref:hypothetical protein n=1 Tax=Eisenbergiella TaxID=1432051 RepID=UPI001F44C865|nr:MULTISPECIES: hypothetical protein [Eisenbergiella]MDY2655086.1 hypothetical protein [Eisenbergiella porci]